MGLERTVEERDARPDDGPVLLEHDSADFWQQRVSERFATHQPQVFALFGLERAYPLQDGPVM
ncbi:hypothetical protein [Paenarthrobacter histidinolovorans]|uniref:hypothetical protein n=1 Tax=Paenarthrobacter histidinolovorans TaxID=43664 RepID=UPI00384DAD5C